MFSETLDAIRDAKDWIWMYGYRRDSARAISEYVRANPGRVLISWASSATTKASPGCGPRIY